MNGGELFFGCARHIAKMPRIFRLISVHIGVLVDEPSTLSALLDERMPAEHNFLPRREKIGSLVCSHDLRPDDVSQTRLGNLKRHVVVGEPRSPD